MSKEENKENKQGGIDTPILFVIIYLPIMMILFMSVLTGDDPNSLLTEEQKLEKQKQIALEKDQRELESQEQQKFYDDGINWFVYEKPFPLNILIGVGIFFFVAWGMNLRSRRFDGGMFELFSNPITVLSLTCGLFYLLWVSGELENMGIL